MTFESAYPVILIGDDINALGVIRSLPYCQIYLLYASPMSIIKYSRHINKSFRIYDTSNESSIYNTLNIIIDNFIPKGKTPVLLTSSDWGAIFLSKYKNTLSKRFIIGIDDWPLISKLTNKFEMYKLANEYRIETPYTLQADEIIKSSINNLPFPLIVKPSFEHFPLKIFPGKAIKVLNRDSLIRTYNKLLKCTPRNNILLQEFIPGPPGNIYSFCSYAKKGEVLSYYIAQNKIREFSLEFGVGTFAKTIRDCEFENLGKKFIKCLGYSGVSEIDFKKDPRDNKFKLLEINVRFYAQNLLGKACGVNLTDIYYKDLTNSKNVYFPASYKENVYWLDITRDMPYILKDIFSGNISLKGAFDFTISKKISSLFCSKDPLPFICELLLLPLKILLNLKKFFS